MQAQTIFKAFTLVLLMTVMININIKASENTTNDYKENPITTFNSTNSKEVVFKTPQGLKNESSKLEYKVNIATPSNSLWNLVDQQESSSQFNPKIVKKDDSNFLSFVATNQFPTNTIRIAIDQIEVVDIDNRFVRIPNIKTEATNDYVYVSKANLIRNYKPTSEEIANYNTDKPSTIYLNNQSNRYSAQNPTDKNYQIAMIQEKVGDNDWNYAKHLNINLTANSPLNLEEADKLIKESKFDNENYQLVAPVVSSTNNTPTNNNNTSSNPTPSSTPEFVGIGNNFNIVPWIATIAGFGILNFGIRQYFKK
jgi:hypothetical protein